MRRIDNPFYSEAEWIDVFESLKAFWRHDGNVHRPHALLTGGGHSNGFFNWSMVAQYPAYAAQVVADLLSKTSNMVGDADRFGIDYVIGPATGAITLADRLADNLHHREHPNCRFNFTEKKEGRPVLRVPIDEGARVMVCEDTITTGKSVADSIEVIETAGGIVLPFVLAVCNRSGEQYVGDRAIISLITTPMDNWTPEECPLCKQGSNAIRPKADDNWKLLTQHY